jgi:hypothetical protein
MHTFLADLLLLGDDDEVRRKLVALEDFEDEIVACKRARAWLEPKHER